jgi:putative Holliday junction resolvase
MARLMGIDYGQKRTGIAVSDPLQIFPRPLDTVDTPKLMDYIKKYCAEEDVETFVIGEPTHKDGNDTYLTPIIRIFAADIQKIFPDCKVVLWDERYTSILAKQAIMASGAKKKERQDKGLIDRISAVIILQEYMERSDD